MTNSSTQDRFGEIVQSCLRDRGANSLSDIPIGDEHLVACTVWAKICGLMTETGPEELGTELKNCYLNSPYLYIIFSSYSHTNQEGEYPDLVLAGVFYSLYQFILPDAKPKLGELLDRSRKEYCEIRGLNLENLYPPLNNANSYTKRKY